MIKAGSSKPKKLEGGRSLKNKSRRPEPVRPLVSVITVVLNARNLVARTVSSVRAQTYDNIEYIIIDGGSDDGTVEELQRLEESIDRWTSEPDNGIAEAFNKGLSLANGEIVGILNAGDVYEPRAISAIVEAYGAQPETDVACGAIRLTERGVAPLVCLPSPSRLELETAVYHPAVFVRRAAYQRFGYFNEAYRFAMDYELLLRFRKAGAVFQVLTEVLATMDLTGISGAHWYRGLSEVRRARAVYFSSGNVLFHHVRAVLMNLLARGLRIVGLGRLHRAYWRLRNLRTPQRERAQQTG
jgi:glycosyltransferase involved in cell wall biosynthesis